MLGRGEEFVLSAGVVGWLTFVWICFLPSCCNVAPTTLGSTWTQLGDFAIAFWQISWDLSKFTVPFGGRILLINVVDIDGFWPTRPTVVMVADNFAFVKVLGRMEGSISETGILNPNSLVELPSLDGDAELWEGKAEVIELDSDLVEWMISSFSSWSTELVWDTPSLTSLPISE